MIAMSRHRQRVVIPAAGLEITFEADEPIWTESSHKYEPEQVLEDGRSAGFARGEQWIASDARFAVTRFDVSP